MKNIFKRTAALLCASFMVVSGGFMSACKPENPDVEKPPVIKPTEDTYTVFFYRNCEANVEEPEIEVKKGETVEFQNPSRLGWEVENWYLEPECTNVYDFTQPVTGDLELYAKWVPAVTRYEVAFNLNGASGTIEKQIIVSGNKVEMPKDPTFEGKKFGGWYLDAGCTTAFNTEMAITANTTLYAKWISLFTVTTNPNYEGATNATIEVEEGSAATLTAPTRTDYEFAGWFTDAGCTAAFDASTKITANITLYAKWVSTAAQKFVYTFKYNYEGAPGDTKVDVLEDALVVAPEVTAPEGMKFEGWYLDAECTQAANLLTGATADVTLYAKWSEVVSVTFNYNYEGAPQANVVAVAKDSAMEKPTDPVRPGYTFAGWSTAADVDPNYDFTAVVNEATTLYAQWTKLYVFEAEDVDLDGLNGFGFSGNALDTNMIHDDSLNVGASNGYYLWCLNNSGLTIEFKFTSDREAKNVDFTIALSAEIKDIVLVSDGDPQTEGVFIMNVNGTEIDYGQIEINNVPSQSDGKHRPFTDFTYKIDIQKGQNSIKLIMANQLNQGGTMNATAPMIDCIKLLTSANLVFVPKANNYAK